MITSINKEIENIGRYAKNIFQEKMGEIICVPINNIQISEFMTRANSVNEGMVADLMNEIKNNSFIPTSAMLVNVITDINSNPINYRLVAGRHRFEACKRLGMKELPCLAFTNLSDEEECILDRVDNEKDERHRPYHFLEIAEHFKYLQQMKEWSIRQIARVKNVSKSDVARKLQIANLPEDVKVIFVTVPIGDTFLESYFRDICRLKSIPHQVLVCRTIMDSGNKYESSELKNMVEQLLIVEQQGRIAEEAMKYIKDDGVKYLSMLEDIRNITLGELNTQIQENNPIRQIAELMELKIFEELFEKRDNKGLRFTTSPMWLRHCGLQEEISMSSYCLLQELISYDLRYQPDRDNFFFIAPGDIYNNTEELLARVTGVKVNTLEKKLFPLLKEYINIKKTGEVLKFQIKWDKLYDLYKKNAHKISYEDGGLKNIPNDFTGWIRPTPYHGIFIENGLIKKYENIESKKKEQSVKNNEKSLDILISGKQQEKTVEVNKKENKPVAPYSKEKQIYEKAVTKQTNAYKKDVPAGKSINTSPLAEKLRNMSMAEPQINVCVENKDVTEDVIKYVSEMPPVEKESIKNIPGFIYKLVKDGFKPPEGFESSKQVEEKEKRKEAIKDFVENFKEKLNSREIKYFTPDGKKYNITSVPNDSMFLYMKDGKPQCARFCEFMDESLFSG